MQNVSCPSCGAKVLFKSHASVMAVCEYCKTTILKDADSIKDMGRMSDVLEDYSPIQIGTSGTFGKTGFTVIGRIQLRYPEGIWNEWYVLFDDGRPAWLGDASGQYTITFEKQHDGPLPAFEAIRPGRNYTVLGEAYLAGDVRTADCIGGQGELPFRVGKGWQAKVADLHHGRSFVTLDYSESGKPKIYAGLAVSLVQLKCQLLRDDDTIKESAGKVRGKVQPFQCPSCGSNVRFVPGVTREIICPSCRARVDTSTRIAVVLDTGHRLAKTKTTLELGAKATISGAAHKVIGILIRSDDEGTSWTEYLLYSPRSGFTWLIETDEAWSRTAVLGEWPSWDGGSTATIDSQRYRKKYDYTAEVQFAAGAFNWRVSTGDRVRVVEFEYGKNTLAAELTDQELTWSLATPVGADQIRAWFGKDVKADKLPPKTALPIISKFFIYAILMFNAIPLMLAFGQTWHYVLFAILAIYLPAQFLVPAAAVAATSHSQSNSTSGSDADSSSDSDSGSDSD